MKQLYKTGQEVYVHNTGISINGESTLKAKIIEYNPDKKMYLVETMGKGRNYLTCTEDQISLEGTENNNKIVQGRAVSL
jgi:hypothetical protein